MKIKEITRYRADVERLLVDSIRMTMELEQRWGITGGWEAAHAQVDLDAHPVDGARIEAALLLRKAKLHTLAAIHANKKNNLHSFAVQMRPALECIGLIVFLVRNLVIVGKERGLHSILDYEDSVGYYHLSSTIGKYVTKSDISNLMSSAAAKAAESVGVPKIRTKKAKKRRFTQNDKVSLLAGGNNWYDHLSRYFVHGDGDWTGDPMNGSVTSTDTALDDLAFATIMDYLANQVTVMNAYAAWYPVNGIIDDDWLDRTVACWREVVERSNDLKNELIAALNEDRVTVEV